MELDEAPAVPSPPDAGTRPPEELAMRRLIVVLVPALVAVVVVTAPARAPLTIAGFSLSPHRFAIPTSGPAAARPSVPIMRFRLSSRATVKIVFARRVGGRRSRGLCVKAKRGLSNHHACTRYAAVGNLVRRGMRAGTVVIPFSGRLRGKALRPGAYRATIVAVGRSHRRSEARRARFTVLAGAGGASGSGQGPAPSPPPGNSTSTGGFPDPSNTGVPTGWAPARTFASLTVTTPGAVISDVEVNGDVNINAPNVTLRRVLIRGVLNNMNDGTCRGNGLVVEDSTFEPPGGAARWSEDQWQMGQGGYTLRRVEAINESDGPRVGGHSLGCGTVNVQDTYIGIAAIVPCGAWHGDGIQGYDAGRLNVTNVTIDFKPNNCGGNAGFFFPGGSDNPASGPAYANISG